MGQNRLKLMCNPYNKKISIMFTDKEGDDYWSDISDSSDLNKFTRGEKSIQNCGKELIEIAQKKYNMGTAGLGIIFCGTLTDYSDFESIAKRAAQKSEKKLSVSYDSRLTLPESNYAVKVIEESYEKVKKEFLDFLPESSAFTDLPDEQKKIGEAIQKYNDIKKSELNICVIGTYSSGKSTFINALIGAELLPKDAHPTTAKATKIHNGSKYEIKFMYSFEEVTIIWENGTYRYMYNEMKIDKSYSSLMRIIDLATKGFCKVTEQMNAAISVFNISPEDEPDKADILNKVAAEINITFPFRETYLNSSETQFTILDTPGSNSKTFSEEHQKVLTETLKEQTNSLPVFVVQNDQLDTTDNAELKKALDKYKTTLDVANMLVIINKADEIELHDLKSGIKKEISRNWESTKLLYVASIIGLGSKKKDEEWSYSGYRQKYIKYKEDFLGLTEFKIELYRYSIIPDADKYDIENAAEKQKNDYSRLYHNSGLYAVEYEISKYANKYLMYLKARERNQHLLTALELSEKALLVKKEEIKNKKYEYERAKNKKKVELEEKIKNSKFNDKKCGKVIDDVEKEFENRRKVFIESISRETARQWTSIRKIKGLSGEEKTKRCHINMMNYCGDFYAKIFPDIKKSIEDKFIDVASQYKNSIIIMIKSDGELSDEAKDSIFKRADISEPKFEGSYSEFKGEGAFSQFIWIKWINPNKYSSKLVDIFDGKFRNDCISQPHSIFMSTLKAWIEDTKNKFNQSLEINSITLKQFDKQIFELHNNIEMLGKRIENLQGVNCELKNLLVFKEKKHEKNTV